MNPNPFVVSNHFTVPVCTSSDIFNCVENIEVLEGAKAEDSPQIRARAKRFKRRANMVDGFDTNEVFVNRFEELLLFKLEFMLVVPRGGEWCRS